MFVRTDPVNKCTKVQEDLMQTVGGDRIFVCNENLRGQNGCLGDVGHLGFFGNFEIAKS